MTHTPDSQLPITTGIPRSSNSADELVKEINDLSDKSFINMLAAASSSVDETPDRAFTGSKSDRFSPQDWKKVESEAITRLKTSVSMRVKRLIENEDYAKLLDKYIALLEENEQLKKQRNPDVK